MKQPHSKHLTKTTNTEDENHTGKKHPHNNKTTNTTYRKQKDKQNKRKASADDDPSTPLPLRSSLYPASALAPCLYLRYFSEPQRSKRRAAFNGQRAASTDEPWRSGGTHTQLTRTCKRTIGETRDKENTKSKSQRKSQALHAYARRYLERCKLGWQRALSLLRAARTQPS